MSARPFVAYYRVSTQKQGASGLGLDAQKESVSRFVRGADIVSEFTEIESGKNNARPKLAAAVAYCKKHRATLVIAKLDRLARNVHFVSGLMESGIDFVCCDNPEANRLTIHILAAVAEHEARTISERTKAALAAARARGTKLGGKRHDMTSARKAINDRVAEFHARVMPAINEVFQWSPHATDKDVAEALNARGIRTARGGEWSSKQVARVLEAQP